jgi:transglutaminase-like putative cysteine protease
VRRDLTMAGASAVLVATAAVPLHRVFTTTEWRPAVLATIVVATALAAAMRRLRIPGPAALLLSLGALAAFAARLHAVDAGPWPTPDALAELWELGRQGFEDIRLQPAPTPPLDGIRLLLTGGVWLVAHVSHEALVRLRRPGVALVAAGLLWFTPLAVPRTGLAAWPNALPFFVAAGLVLLLDPDPDEAGWTREDTVPRLRTGGVVLAVAAAVVGLVAPWLVPGYGQPAWVDVTAATDPRGYQPIVDVGDRLNLPDPRDVLEVSSTRASYLRLAALDTFDGRTWRLGPPDVETFRPDPDQLFSADGPLPFETEIRDGTAVTSSIEVLDLENIYVPVPYQVARISGPDGANLFYSRQGGFVATGEVEDNELRGQTRVGVREGFTYELEAFVPTPTYDDLQTLGRLEVPADDPRLALPAGYEEFGELAEQVMADAGAENSIDRVLAVQDFFAGPDAAFTYSTDVPELRGDDALRDFLFETRTGYCEYYATSMGVMLRAAGVPARVAVGFLPGRVTDRPDAEGEPATFTVSTSDAHAWVEVWFDEYGWIRMDPTPRSETLAPSSSDLDPQPDAAQPLPDSPSEGVSAPDSLGRVPDPANTFDDQFAEGGGLEGSGIGFGGGMSRWVLGLLVLVVLVVVVSAAVYAEPLVRRVLARHHADPATDVLASMRRVLATADHLGVGRRRDQTITETALGWADRGLVDPDDAATFARLASRAAFAAPDGPTGPDADDAATMRALEPRLLAGLHGAVDRRTRLTAPWRRVADRTGELVSRFR